MAVRAVAVLLASAIATVSAGVAVLVLASVTAWAPAAWAEEEPPTLAALYEAAPGSDAGAVSFAEEKRADAMRLAAVAFGARAGLARRSWEIAGMLEGFERQLSRIYRFDRLVLRRSGFQVLPPVLGETRQAFRLARTRARAASAERVLRIVEAERIVSAVPHWRDFLVRRWRLAEPPAAVLFPREGEERARWRRWLREGWLLGRAQADDVFASDLDRLNRTFEGLVAWHRLREAAMVSAPVVLAERTGVSGGGRLMRIGEMVVHIADWAALNPRSEEWRVMHRGGCSARRRRGRRRRGPRGAWCAAGSGSSVMADLRWSGGEHAFDVASIDEFLVWAAEQGASDISFQTRSPAFVEIDGVLRRATGVLLDSPAMLELCKKFFGETGDAILRSGDAIDTAHTVKLGRSSKRRFRVNLSAVQVASAFGVNITLRVLPGAVPALEELGIEDEVAEPWRTCRGLTLVTGVPGSGKSTLLAAGTRNLLESGAGRVQSLESPIEFVFDGVGGEEALISQSEVPLHFPDFKSGLRACLRRRPAAVIVGEARDLETVEAVIRAADFGIAVYTTTHTIGVAATIRRLLAEFPVAERAERGAAFVDVLNLVVSQMLLPSPRGGRHALREWLTFDSRLKAALLDAPQDRWTSMIAAALAETGNHFHAAAVRALGDGRIGEADFRRIAAAHGQAGGASGARNNF